MQWSNPKKLTRNNLNKEKERPAVYVILDQAKDPIYIGSSKRLRHRLEALYYGRADYNQVDHKKEMRQEAVYFIRQYTNIERARRIEKQEKPNLKFNDL